MSENRFVGQMTEFQIITPSAPLHSGPAADASLDNEGLFGETFEVTGTKNGFVFGRLITDGYEGWMPKNCLGDLPVPNALLIAPMTHVTLRASVKSPSCFSLSLGAMVHVISTENDCAKITTLGGHGFLSNRHIQRLSKGQNSFKKISDSSADRDWVATAEDLIGSPYKWGGRTAWGLDCSALVQLSLLTAGINAPRDSGPQHHLGMSVNKETNLKRGDLVFWKGHVGIMQDHKRMLHCNAYHMAVTSELLSSANRRIAKIAGPITAFRRVSCNHSLV